MPIIACGLNHTTAPIALREKVVFAPEKLPLYLTDMQHTQSIQEAVILSTCNRSEIYCETQDIEALIDWFCKQHSLSRAELLPALYIHQDIDAVAHMMKVACGLDSMVLGEPQILGQMKQAFSESCAAGTIGPLFHRLFQQVFAVAKEVRSTTAVGACPVSISSTAVNFIKNNFNGNLKHATILLIGAGDTIELVLRYLMPHSPREIIIANRNVESANHLFEKYSAKIFSLTELPDVCLKADIIIAATGSLKPIVTKTMLEKIQKKLFILDIAVPRDVDPAVSDLPNIQLHSIDDLKMIIEKNLGDRSHAAEKAHEMIKNKSQEFMSWLASFDKVAHIIRSYRKQIEDLCTNELIKAKKQLARGDDPESILNNFAHAFTNKLLHAPSAQLRQAGLEGRFELLDLAKQLLTIPVPKVESL